MSPTHSLTTAIFFELEKYIKMSGDMQEDEVANHVASDSHVDDDDDVDEDAIQIEAASLDAAELAQQLAHNDATRNDA
jgi:hypothetical protein